MRLGSIITGEYLKFDVGRKNQWMYLTIWRVALSRGNVSPDIY